MGRPATDVEAVFRALQPFAAREQGIASSEAVELTGTPRSSFNMVVGKLIKDGRLFCMQHSSWTAYFLSPEAAESRKRQLIREAEERLKARWQRKNKRRPVVKAVKMKPSKPVKVNPVEAFKSQPAVIPPTVKITRIPCRPDPRYAVPDEIIAGGFLTEWMDLRRSA